MYLVSPHREYFILRAGVSEEEGEMGAGAFALTCEYNSEKQIVLQCKWWKCYKVKFDEKVFILWSEVQFNCWAPFWGDNGGI